MPLLDKPTETTWKEFETEHLETLSKTGNWIFRGVLDSWEPETSLERACRAWDVPRSEYAKVEYRLTRDFQRHPEARQRLGGKDYLGWWALMQHHGAPTRLMDWSYSPYIAGYFAFEQLLHRRGDPPRNPPPPQPPPEPKAQIWALRTDWLNDQLKEKLPPDDYCCLLAKKNEPSLFAKVFVKRNPPLPFVATATPLRMHQRLSIQQGLFLCPGDVSKPWLENLKATGWSGDPSVTRVFQFTDAKLDLIFERFHRMNITARSLSPGLDGYSKSVWPRLKILLSVPLPGLDM